MKTVITHIGAYVGALAGAGGTVDSTYEIIFNIVAENFKNHSGSVVEPVVKTVLSVALWWASLHFKTKVEQRRARKKAKKEN